MGFGSNRKKDGNLNASIQHVEVSHNNCAGVKRFTDTKPWLRVLNSLLLFQANNKRFVRFQIQI